MSIKPEEEGMEMTTEPHQAETAQNHSRPRLSKKMTLQR